MTTATQVGRERETANAWDKFLEHVKARVSINTFTTWFQPTKLNRAEGETLHIQIPSAVFRQVLAEPPMKVDDAFGTDRLVHR